MGWLTGIGDIFKTVGIFLGILKDDQINHNTPEMKARAQAAKEAAQNDANAQAIKNRDLDKSRDTLS